MRLPGSITSSIAISLIGAETCRFPVAFLLDQQGMIVKVYQGLMNLDTPAGRLEFSADQRG